MTIFATDRPEPGDELELAIGDVAHGGWCVARSGEAGWVIFVRHALPGERVRAVITQVTARFARADAVQILDASPDRVRPPCPHARPGGCGGCDWQHASPEAQRRLKAAVIRQQLRRIAGIERDVTVEPLPGDTGGLGWRSRVSFAVDRDGTAGLRRHRSHEIIPVGECPIAHPLVTGQGITGLSWPGARSVEVSVSPGSGQAAVIVSGGGMRSGNIEKIAADSVLTAGRDGALRTRRGSGYVSQRAAGRDWRVGAGSFWQVHPAAADVLAVAVREALRPASGDVALDLYCGAGLFAGVLADAVGPAGTVIGIETDAGAVRDARHNLRATPWARVHRGDVAAVLGRNGLSGASLAVLDPPRPGVSRGVLDLLCAPAGTGTGAGTGAGTGTGAEAGHESAADGGSLRRIAYVSCDPATLARDLGVLCKGGWRLDGLRGFDAFPMTHHVECLATLARS